MQEERDERNALIAEKKREIDEQKKKCTELKRKLQKKKDARYLYKKTDDPKNPEIISDQERKAEELKHEKYIEKNC